MTFLTWAVRLVILSCVLIFAVSNTETVTLHLVPDLVWQAPLVIVLFVFLGAGVLLGLLSLVGPLFRQRLEISRLQRQLERQPQLVPPVEPPPSV